MVLAVTDHQPISIQLRFAHPRRKNYSELRRNRYAQEQAVIL
jgi:hypothetical protein